MISSSTLLASGWVPGNVPDHLNRERLGLILEVAQTGTGELTRAKCGAVSATPSGCCNPYRPLHDRRFTRSFPADGYMLAASGVTQRRGMSAGALLRRVTTLARTGTHLQSLQEVRRRLSDALPVGRVEELEIPFQ